MRHAWEELPQNGPALHWVCRKCNVVKRKRRIHGVMETAYRLIDGKWQCYVKAWAGGWTPVTPPCPAPKREPEGYLWAPAWSPPVKERA